MDDSKAKQEEEIEDIGFEETKEANNFTQRATKKQSELYAKVHTERKIDQQNEEEVTNETKLNDFYESFQRKKDLLQKEEHEINQTIRIQKAKIEDKKPKAMRNNLMETSREKPYQRIRTTKKGKPSSEPDQNELEVSLDDKSDSLEEKQK